MTTKPGAKRSVSQHTRADGQKQSVNRVGGEFDAKAGSGSSGAAADPFADMPKMTPNEWIAEYRKREQQIRDELHSLAFAEHLAKNDSMYPGELTVRDGIPSDSDRQAITHGPVLDAASSVSARFGGDDLFIATTFNEETRRFITTVDRSPAVSNEDLGIAHYYSGYFPNGAGAEQIEEQRDRAVRARADYEQGARAMAYASLFETASAGRPGYEDGMTLSLSRPGEARVSIVGGPADGEKVDIGLLPPSVVRTASGGRDGAEVEVRRTENGYSVTVDRASQAGDIVFRQEAEVIPGEPTVWAESQTNKELS